MSDLKELNEKALNRRLVVAIVPIYLSAAASHGWDALQSITNQPLAALAHLAAIGIGPLLCLKVLLSLLASVTDTKWKERLAHLRWSNPLPGSRSDKIMTTDPRIDLSNLPPEVDALRNQSLTPRERNARWYRDVYRPVSKEPAVLNSHRHYLLHRDASAGVAMVLIASIVADLASRLIFGVPLMFWPAYFALFIYLTLLITAANLAGKRLVAGAISSFSSNQDNGGNQ